MTYSFKNKDGEVVDKKFSMESVPSEIEIDGEIYRRDFVSESKTRGVIIPDHMKADAQKRVFTNKTKSPSGRKHNF